MRFPSAITRALFCLVVGAILSALPVFVRADTTPSTPAAAPEGELPYEELMAKAEGMLVPQGEKKIIYEGAAIVLFHRAAKVAPDDGKKLEALLRAGQTDELLKQFPSAIKAYDEALALKNISAAQKLRLNFAVANAKFQLAKNESALYSRSADLYTAFNVLAAQPELPSELRVKTHAALAELHASNSKFTEAAQEYQKLLALPNLSSEIRADTISRALAEIAKAGASTQALQIANTLFPQHLATKKAPQEIADAHQRWAKVLEKQNDRAGAIREWNLVANANDTDLNQRVNALMRVSTLHKELKNYPAALAAADRIDALGKSPWIQINFRSQRFAVFLAQNDEPKVRAEWQALIATPDVTPETKATSYNRIAESFKREREVLKDKSRAAALLDGEKKALDAAWKTDGARVETRKTAILERAQIEADAKNWSAASTLLLDGLAVADTWKDEDTKFHYWKQNLNLALSLIFRAEKNYPKAIAALIAAQGSSYFGDNTAGQNALSLMQEAFAAKEWDASRTILLSLSKVWGLPQKTYLYNLAQVEIGAKQWDAARKALDEFDKQAPTAEEAAEAAKLRVLIPAP
jgi:hypothetical protein